MAVNICRVVSAVLISFGVCNAIYDDHVGYYGGRIQGGTYGYGRGLDGAFSPQVGLGLAGSSYRSWGGAYGRMGNFQRPPASLIGGYRASDSYGYPGGYGGPTNFARPGMFWGLGMVGRPNRPYRFGNNAFMYIDTFGFGRRGNRVGPGSRPGGGRFAGRGIGPFASRGISGGFGGRGNGGFAPQYGFPQSQYGAYRSFGYGDNGMYGMRDGPIGYGGFGARRFGQVGAVGPVGFGRSRFGGFARRGGSGFGGIESARFDGSQFTGGFDSSFGGSPFAPFPSIGQTCECRKRCGPKETYVGKCKSCAKKLCLVRCCRYVPFKGL